MIANNYMVFKPQEITPIYYAQTGNTRKNYFQNTATDNFYNITFKFIYDDTNSLANTSNFKTLAKKMSKHFSPGLIINVKFGNIVDYLELKNPQISEEKLFDEFWDFRENVWFTLPNELIKNRHLTIG